MPLPKLASDLSLYEAYKLHAKPKLKMNIDNLGERF